MSNNPTYTLAIVPQGDHLQVTIKELNSTVETAAGDLDRGHALDVAHNAIVSWHLKQREQEAVMAARKARAHAIESRAVSPLTLHVDYS